MYNVDKIRRRMMEQSLNRRHLAIKAGKSVGAIHRFFETGRAHVDTVAAVCNVLGLKVGSIIAETKRKNA